MVERNPEKSFVFLKGVVDENMKNLNTNVKEYEKHALIMKITLLSLSALVTLVIGLKIEVYSANIALILSAALTILTGIDQFLRVTTKDVEISRRHIKITKLSLDMRLCQEGEVFITKEVYDEFKNRFDEILNETLSESKDEEVAIESDSTNSI